MLLGWRVVGSGSACGVDNNVPLVVPEVNPEEILKNRGIIANPNCSTIQAVVVLKPLDDAYKIKRIVYSTYQAVSGAGLKALNDYKNGIKKHLNPLHKYDLEKFDYDIFDNCIPQIDTFEDNLYTKEEMKVVNETRKILHLDEAGKFFDSLLCTGIGVFSDKYIPYQMQTFHNLLTAI